MSNITQRSVRSMYDTEKKDYGSAKNYADEVRQWVEQTQIWMMNQQTQFLQSMRPVMPMINFQTNGVVGVPPNGVGPRQIVRRIMFRIGLNRGGDPQLQTIITQEYQIPTFARRAAAELIDFLILFFFKLILVYFFVEIEVVDLDQYTKILADEVDLSSFIDFTQGLFHLELIAKVICGIIEAYCISFGIWGFQAGCTPGKQIMRIQVVSCLNIVPVPGNPARITVSRLPTVPFGKSLTRAIIKNSIFNVLFPLNTLLYFFSYNRAVYDIVAKTVVVSI